LDSYPRRETEVMQGSPDTKLAPEGGFMAMTIFFLLNGLGVVFLLYVLANFWKESHREKDSERRYTRDFMRIGVADVFVATHPISHNACGGVAVIPVRAPRSDDTHEQDYRRFVDELDRMPIEVPVKSKTLSTR
jgi:hypothetical protein